MTLYIVLSIETTKDSSVEVDSLFTYLSTKVMGRVTRESVSNMRACQVCPSNSNNNNH